MKRVLIFEPNHYHYEVIPGTVKYFIDLGYTVDVLEYEHPNDGDEFCLCDCEVNRIYIKGDYLSTLKELLSSVKYELIFLNSYDYIMNGQLVSIYDEIKGIDNTVKGVFGFSHDYNNLAATGNADLPSLGRVCVLSKMGMKNVFEVNAHYFGDITKKEKNKTCKMLSVGVSNDSISIMHRLESISDDCFVDFIGRKQKKSFKSKFKSTILKYLYYITRKDSLEIYKPIDFEAVSHKVKIYEDVPFEDLYKMVNDTDFIIITIVDKYAKEFMTTKTTGSKQLSLGFCKPCIIEADIAKAYGFTNENAIVFEKGHLKEAMELAISMNDDGYQHLCDNLRKYQQDVYNMSLNNLKCQIN